MRGKANNATTHGIARAMVRASMMEMNTADQIRVLFLAANPKGMEPLNIQEEFSSIDAALSETAHANSFLLNQRSKVNRDQLLDLLTRYRPHILHFSGHGIEGQILLEDRERSAWPIDGPTMRDLLRVAGSTIRLVFLNACYSQDIAQDISEIVECVIGMALPIYDKTAIAFARPFYRALGENQSIRQAFDHGRAQVDLSDTGEKLIPQILARPGVDPRRILPIQHYLTSQGSTSASTSQPIKSEAAAVATPISNTKPSIGSDNGLRRIRRHIADAATVGQTQSVSREDCERINIVALDSLIAALGTGHHIVSEFSANRQQIDLAPEDLLKKQFLLLNSAKDILEVRVQEGRESVQAMREMNQQLAAAHEQRLNKWKW